jgi:hypothetical protein
LRYLYYEQRTRSPIFKITSNDCSLSQSARLSGITRRWNVRPYTLAAASANRSTLLSAVIYYCPLTIHRLYFQPPPLPTPWPLEWQTSTAPARLFWHGFSEQGQKSVRRSSWKICEMRKQEEALVSGTVSGNRGLYFTCFLPLVPLFLEIF